MDKENKDILLGNHSLANMRNFDGLDGVQSSLFGSGERGPSSAENIQALQVGQRMLLRYNNEIRYRPGQRKQKAIPNKMDEDEDTGDLHNDWVEK